jgi:predicted GNAT family acetyltransferase
VHRGDTLVGCAFRTPPQQLVLSRMPPAAVEALVENVGNVYRTLPSVTGPKDETEAFALAWTMRRDGAWHIRIRLQIHSLTRVAPAHTSPSGELRQARPEDLSFVREWVDAYVRDTGIAPPTIDVAATLIDRGRLYLWAEGGAPRSMAAAGRDTTTGCAIHTVYTPPHFRRRGFATAAVAALSHDLLRRGRRFCCLYTDAANPTSNSIYAKLGYRPVRDDVEIAFETSDG